MIWVILQVYFTAMLKFLFAFPIGVAQNLNLPLTILSSIAGMMSMVGLILLFKKQIKTFIYKIYFNKRNKFTKTNRKIVSIYQRFGIWGIAFATPPLLTPIGGTLVAVTRGESSRKIIGCMFVAALSWGLVWGTFLFYLKDAVYSFFGWA